MHIFVIVKCTIKANNLKSEDFEKILSIGSLWITVNAGLLYYKKHMKTVGDYTLYFLQYNEKKVMHVPSSYTFNVS